MVRANSKRWPEMKSRTQKVDNERYWPSFIKKGHAFPPSKIAPALPVIGFQIRNTDFLAQNFSFRDPSGDFFTLLSRAFVTDGLRGPMALKSEGGDSSSFFRRREDSSHAAKTEKFSPSAR